MRDQLQNIGLAGTQSAEKLWSWSRRKSILSRALDTPHQPVDIRLQILAKISVGLDRLENVVDDRPLVQNGLVKAG